jgi:predicted O-methyltransferase YrrM
MKIKRSVLEKMAALAPKFFDKHVETALVFDRPTPGRDKVRWGGDVDFCNRWRALGGRIFAEMELRLGHTATIVIRDSLGSHLRRVTGETLRHVIGRIRTGVETDADYNEVFKYAGNPWAADAGVLAMVTGIARKCRGPIIETGSGLSSVLMGAFGERVYSLEHAEHYAAQTLAWAEEAGVENTGICCAPMKDFWYDIDKFDLPRKFAFGFCDGPPRFFGTRMKFFELIAPRCTVIAVDDFQSDMTYANKVRQWARDHGYEVQILGRAALLTKAAALSLAA